MVSAVTPTTLEEFDKALVGAQDGAQIRALALERTALLLKQVADASRPSDLNARKLHVLTALLKSLPFDPDYVPARRCNSGPVIPAERLATAGGYWFLDASNLPVAVWGGAAFSLYCNGATVLRGTVPEGLKSVVFHPPRAGDDELMVRALAENVQALSRSLEEATLALSAE